MTGHPTERPAVRRSDLVLFVVGALVLVAVSSVMAWRMSYALDESSHLTVVDVLADEGRLLTWEDTEYGPDRGHVYHLYSPVSYLPYVPARWIADAVGPLDGAAHPDHVVVRFGAWSIVLAQFAVTWSLVRRLLRFSPSRLALAVAFAVNLLPQLRYMHASVTTDGMTVLAGTVAVAVAVRVLQRPKVDWVDGLLAGLAVALCAHVRYNALIVGSVALLALGWRAVQTDQQWRLRLRPLGVALAVALVLAAPFHLWAYQEQANRHWTVSESHEMIMGSTFRGRFPEEVSTSELISIRLKEVDSVGVGMWLGFHRYHAISSWTWRILALLTIQGIVAAMFARQITRSNRVLTGVLVVASFVTWVAMAAQWPFTAQGRFLLPAGFSLIVVAVSGFTALLDERSRIPAVLAPAVVSAAFGGLLLIGIRSFGI